MNLRRGLPFRGTPPAPRARGVRAAVVAGLAAGTLLAPVQLARGLPRTRFAALPAGVQATAEPETGAFRAAGLEEGELAAPAVPPAAAPEVTMPFPVSHLGLRWRGSELAALDARLADADGHWG